MMRETHRPTCLVLSRQALPTIDRKKYNDAAGLARGAYVLADPPGGAAPELILMASGSEVQFCVEAYEKLTAEGARVRVVSMPSWDIFERQDEAYRRSLFPGQVRARVAVEQAATLGWDRYAGPDGRIIGMHSFGASAPIKALLEHFGFTAEAVLAAARDELGKHALRKAAE